MIQVTVPKDLAAELARLFKGSKVVEVSPRITDFFGEAADLIEQNGLARNAWCDTDGGKPKRCLVASVQFVLGQTDSRMLDDIEMVIDAIRQFGRSINHPTGFCPMSWSDGSSKSEVVAFLRKHATGQVPAPATPAPSTYLRRQAPVPAVPAPVREPEPELVEA